jgi:tRNA pseudouridine38-40 synthase
VRYFIKLSYKGTPFFGWQIQPNAPTVQSKLEESLSRVLRDKIGVTGCGRTDSGVHASEFFAHFDTDQSIEIESLKFKLNCMIPKEIAIHEIYPVPEDLHARFSAEARTYHYFINQKKDAFRFQESWLMHADLNIKAMNEACGFLIGKQDFTSFSKLHTQTKTNLCTITEAYWAMNNDQLIFTVTADRFLHNMVRAIVGTTVEVGKEKISPLEFKNIILAQNRQKAGASVPAVGLFLARIKYPIEFK